MSYISNITVYYGKQQPPNTILELNGGNADLNKDFQGHHVYLVAERTADPNLACNQFEVVIQDKEDPLHKELSKGTGGDFRYLLSLSNIGEPEKVIDVRLLRSSKPIESPPAGFAGMTSDINKGRKGAFLYLIWTTAKTDTLKPSEKPYPVVYGSTPSGKPPGAISELHNNNSDINAGFGGSYVWIVPTFTSNARSAVTDFEIVIQGRADGRYRDLAKDAGGDYRYCIPVYDIDNRHKITHIRLLRSDAGIFTPPAGYDKITTDINRGRGGSFLYVISQVATV